VLQSRGFRWLVTVRLVGSYGDGLVQAALATFVLFNPERAATPTKVAIAFTVLLLPYSLVGPFAGVLLDRWRRRQVLVYANLVRALLVVLLAVVVAHGGTGWSLALVVLVVLGINRFATAALSAGTPHVVPAPYLVTANAIGPTLGTVALVLGGLSGVALRELVGGATRGSVTVLAVGVLTYAAAGLVALTLRRDELGPVVVVGPRETLASVARGLAAGVRHLRTRPRAGRAIALMTAQRAAFGIAVALAVLQVRGALHPPSQAELALRDLSLTTGVAGVGALIGAVITPRPAKRWGTFRWAVTAMVVAVTIAAGCVSSVSLAGLLAAGVLMGFAGQAMKVCSDTVVQAEVDDAHLGRVFSLYDMSVNVATVVGLTYALLISPPDGRSWLAPASMVAIVWLAGALALRATRRDDVAPPPTQDQRVRPDQPVPANEGH
jgi:hypothetical protein